MVLARRVDGYLRLPLRPPEHYIGRENGLLKVMVQGKGPKEAQIYLVDVLVEGE
jgi:hypothetical protein